MIREQVVVNTEVGADDKAQTNVTTIPSIGSSP